MFVRSHDYTVRKKVSAAILEKRLSMNNTRYLRFVAFLVVLIIRRDAQALSFCRVLKVITNQGEQSEYFSTDRRSKRLSAISKGLLFNCEEPLKTEIILRMNYRFEIDELALCDGYFLFLRRSKHLRWMNRLLIKKNGVGLLVSCFNLGNVAFLKEERMFYTVKIFIPVQ